MLRICESAYKVRFDFKNFSVSHKAWRRVSIACWTLRARSSSCSSTEDRISWSSLSRMRAVLMDSLTLCVSTAPVRTWDVAFSPDVATVDAYGLVIRSCNFNVTCCKSMAVTWVLFLPGRHIFLRKHWLQPRSGTGRRKEKQTFARRANMNACTDSVYEHPYSATRALFFFAV